MENGYNIFWTSNALNELEETIQYLQHHFSDKEIKKLAVKIENFAEIISQNPFVFPKAGNKNIHKAVILKFNTVYYRVLGKNVEILSFFSNRQSPDKKRLT
jgi:plasmid stabilization system protein ParE